MKSITFLMVFVPATITLMSAGMLVLGMHSALTIPAWFLWEVSLNAGLAVLVSIGLISAAWLFRPSQFSNKTA